MPKTVLIVEDEAAHMKIATRALERTLTDVLLVKATNGREAMDLIHGGLKPDLIVLDLKMPIMDGWEFLAEQKEVLKHARIPTIILSTSAESRDVNLAYDRGANSYLQKPIRSADFRKAVETLGIYWLQTALLPA